MTASRNRRASTRRRAILGSLLLLALLGSGDPPRACGDTRIASEYVLKAAMIYNLALFVEWPEQSFSSATQPMSVCVLGDDPFGAALEANISGKTVRGREMQIRRTQKPSELQGCHILFVSQSERKRLAEIMAAVGSASTLTIGDMKEFVEEGGVIGFTTGNERIRIEINLKAAQRAGLKISYKLLSLATVRGPEAKNLQ